MGVLEREGRLLPGLDYVEGRMQRGVLDTPPLFAEAREERG